MSLSGTTNKTWQHTDAIAGYADDNGRTIHVPDSCFETCLSIYLNF